MKITKFFKKLRRNQIPYSRYNEGFVSFEYIGCSMYINVGQSYQSDKINNALLKFNPEYNHAKKLYVQIMEILLKHDFNIVGESNMYTFIKRGK